MPISLEAQFKKFALRIDACNNSFERSLTESFRLNARIDRSSYYEGIISKLWQSWCTFSRDIIISSIQGARTASGQITNSPFSGNTEGEIAYIAKQALSNKPIKNIKDLAPHSEPTWGDLNTINTTIPITSPTNQNQILQNLGTVTTVNSLQICRNACAHINMSTYNKIKSLQTLYHSSKIRHPSDIAQWIDPATNDFLWRTWIMDMKDASSRSIQ